LGLRGRREIPQVFELLEKWYVFSEYTARVSSGFGIAGPWLGVLRRSFGVTEVDTREMMERGRIMREDWDGDGDVLMMA
jgi:hypothetical protein